MFSAMFGSKPSPPVVEWGAASPLAAAAAPSPGAAIPSTTGRISPKNSRSKKNEIIVGNPLNTPERKGKRLHQLIRKYAYEFKSESNQADIVRDALALIRENVDLNTRDSHGMTTLLNACTRGSADIALAILEKGGRGIDINAKGMSEFANGHTPLTQACYNRFETVALKLIELGANLDEINNRSETALMLACEEGLLPVVIELIDKGANIHLKNFAGLTALDKTCHILQGIHESVESEKYMTAELRKIGYTVPDYNSSISLLKKEKYIAIAKLLLRRGLKSESCNMIEELQPKPPSGPRPSGAGAGAGAGEAAGNAPVGKPGPIPPSYPRGAANAAKEKWVTYKFHSGIILQIADLTFVNSKRESGVRYYSLTCNIKYKGLDGKEYTENIVPLLYSKDLTGLNNITVKTTGFGYLDITDDREAERFSKQLDDILSGHAGGKRRSKRTRHRKGKNPQRSRKNRR